ncbi:hypothetical protein [Amycolatopsis echigonensis]|uniref:Uncharacterized protein n=1 Tax=Amycolatopsis echigonensis TaxID=2576905 RepID=A0A8E1VXZ9_9PSEU|nr:hypothetical protein [Amycolatopsis echigonensis]MBB2500247.1 hypothetical protein [Amycolatopsis echigonensis]
MSDADQPLTPDDEADLALMRTPRGPGEPIPEEEMQAAARYVRRHYKRDQVTAPWSHQGRR